MKIKYKEGENKAMAFMVGACRNLFKCETQTSLENHSTVTAWFTSSEKLIRSQRSNHERYGFIFTYFVVIFTFFKTNHREPLREITAPL